MTQLVNGMVKQLNGLRVVYYNCKIKDLSIHNCLNITNDGLANLITVEKLSIYNLQKLTDDVFKNLTKLSSRQSITIFDPA